MQPAWVLHQRSFRDTSLIVDLLTRDDGRVAVVARAARRPRSPLASIRSCFVPLAIRWRGRGDLLTLLQAEPVAAIEPLSGHALFSGFYVNELLMKLLTRSAPCPDVFELYGDVIHRLTGTADDDVSGLQQTLRLFELRLLCALGYAPLLNQEAENGLPIDEQRRYLYRHQTGPVSWIDGRSMDEGILVTGKTLLALYRGELKSPQTYREAKQLMRFVLSHHLGGKPIRSRELYREYLQNRMV